MDIILYMSLVFIAGIIGVFFGDWLNGGK